MNTSKILFPIHSNTPKTLLIKLEKAFFMNCALSLSIPKNPKTLSASQPNRSKTGSKKPTNIEVKPAFILSYKDPSVDKNPLKKSIIPNIAVINHPITGRPLSAIPNPLAKPLNRLPKIGIFVKNVPIDFPNVIMDLPMDKSLLPKDVIAPKTLLNIENNFVFLINTINLEK